MIDEYIKDLTLIYFYNFKEEYTLNNLMKSLGLNKLELDLLINQLINENLLFYNKFIIQISKLGMKRIEKYLEEKDKVFSVEIKSQISEVLEKIYIPKDFDKKL